MVDFTRGTGNAGTMLIRDQGWFVEYWIHSADSATWFGSAPWNYTVNGGSGGGNFAYSTGSPWVHIATLPVGYNQSIKFGIGATGTWGIGGPTDFWQWIQRADVPGKPSGFIVSSIGQTSVVLAWTRPPNNGAELKDYQIAHGRDPNVEEVTLNFLDPLSSKTVPDLYPGTTQYFWIRYRNDVGWGPWSDRVSAKTLGGAFVRIDGVWKTAVPLVKDAGVWKPALPYIKVSGVWRESQNVG